MMKWLWFVPIIYEIEAKDIYFYGENCQNNDECDANLICFNATCRCKLEYSYYPFTNRNLPTNSKGMCIHFEQMSTCDNDKQCQDMDLNVICDKKLNRCRCANQYRFDYQTKYCQKVGKFGFRSIYFRLLIYSFFFKLR